MKGDRIQRMILEDLDTRCVAVYLESVVAQVLARGDYPEPVARLLSELLATAALCSAGLKFSGRISLQVRAGGPVRLLMADCTHEGGLRGLARFDDQAIGETDSFAGLTAGGILTITLEPADREPWQGVVPLSGESLAAAVTGYFEQSEQLPSRLLLASGPECSAGVLVQQLPGGETDPEEWRRIDHLLATVADDELLEAGPETLLHRLFHSEDRRRFEPTGLHFHCPCNRERVASMLQGLGQAELEDILAEAGRVEVHCEFCNQGYEFDRLDIAALIAGDVGSGPEPDPTIH